MSESIFPTEMMKCSENAWIEGKPGLTKRELFAAMAMQGLLLHKMIAMYDRNSGQALGFAPPAASVAASMAVACADALIAALAAKD